MNSCQNLNSTFTRTTSLVHQQVHLLYVLLQIVGVGKRFSALITERHSSCSTMVETTIMWTRKWTFHKTALRRLQREFLKLSLMVPPRRLTPTTWTIWCPLHCQRTRYFLISLLRIFFILPYQDNAVTTKEHPSSSLPAPDLTPEASKQECQQTRSQLQDILTLLPSVTM